MENRPRTAAVYVRMSKEDQRYSTENQAAAITEYALLHHYEIVATFSDPGISGLDLKHRPGLRALLATVKAPECPFQTILVLDVSRWGRFQDIDESAYYEFLCREAGVQVQYCGEMFTNDHSPYSSLVKAIKRIMAAEYSRELGKKVFAGQCRLAALGFKQGGSAQVGFRRLLLDEHGNAKQFLKRGQRKSLVTNRVILVPGPRRERRLVNRIFQEFVDGRSVNAITAELRRKKILGRRWTTTTVYEMLRNPKYIGTYTFNCTSSKLRSKSTDNPPDQWIRTERAIDPILPLPLWERVQWKLSHTSWLLSDEQYLDALRDLWRKEGCVTARAIDTSPEMPSAAAYVRRFGSIMNAKHRIGLPGKTNELLTRRRLLAELRLNAWEALKANVRDHGLHLKNASRERYKIHIAGVPILNFVLAHPLDRGTHGPAWMVKPPRPAAMGRSVIGMLSLDRKEIRQFVVTDRLRNSVAKKFTFMLPTLVGFTLAKFDRPAGFCDALRSAGYIDIGQAGVSR